MNPYLFHTGDATLLRRVNESAILDLVREEGPISRSEIARRLHLSASTVTRIVNALMAENLLLESEEGSSSGGRRPILLTLNHRSSLIVGVYVGQTMVGALADLQGTILERRSVSSLPGEGGVAQLEALIGELLEVADDLGIRVRGVGVGAPSVTDFARGVVRWAPALGWRDLPLGERLEEALGVPVFVENEVNLIALGESWRGAGRGIANLLCISLGAGIGAGLILDGKLYRGSRFASGEVGYIVPNRSFLGQSCETYGSLESIAGSEGIVKRTLAHLNDGDHSSLRTLVEEERELLTVERVLAAACEGDRLALAVVAETVDYLSLAVANLACILDPERIVISGELADFGELFIEPILERIRGLVPEVPELVVTELKMDAPVLGAVAIALRQTSGKVVVQPARL